MDQNTEPIQVHETPSEESPKFRISPVLVIFLLIPLFGMGVALAMLAAESANQSTSQTSSVIQPIPSILGSPAENFEVSTLDGEPVQLTDYRGRVVFLNFWATWCVPCIRELPTLQRFASEQGEDGAVVLAVNSVETGEQITAYLTDNEIDLSNVPVLMDGEAGIYQRFGVYQLPTTYVINPQGIIRMVKYGEFDLEGLYAYLETVLNESASNSAAPESASS